MCTHTVRTQCTVIYFHHRQGPRSLMRHREKVKKFEENKKRRDEKNLGHKIYSKKNRKEESKNKNKREE